MTVRLKKWLLTSGILGAVLFLSGCIRTNEAGNPVGPFSNFLFNFVVGPTEAFLEWTAGIFGSYGWAIIILTIVVHLIILPFSLKQKKSMMVSQKKMAAVQPAINEIQAELKETKNPQEKQYLQEELMEVYQQNDMNVFASLAGCFPLLIQFPIFIGVFHVLQNSQSIANATFLGLELGQSSVILGVIVGIVYYFQTKSMMDSYPEDQKKQMGMMTMTMPLMLGFISITSPAGLGLYFLAGGIFTTIQTILTNRVYTPQIEAEIEAKYGETQKVERKEKPDFDSATGNPDSATKSEEERIKEIIEKNRQRNQQNKNK